MFGSALEEVMETQETKLPGTFDLPPQPNCEGVGCSVLQPLLSPLYGVHSPGRDIPWVVTTLAEAILRHNGAKTEGIFR